MIFKNKVSICTFVSNETFINFLRDGALLEFYLNRVRAVGFNPRIFGALGYHLWFLGFLFMFSLVAIASLNTPEGINLGTLLVISSALLVSVSDFT